MHLPYLFFKHQLIHRKELLNNCHNSLDSQNSNDQRKEDAKICEPQSSLMPHLSPGKLSPISPTIALWECSDIKYVICFKDRLQKFTRKYFQRDFNSLQKYRHELLMSLRFRSTGPLGNMASCLLCVTCRLGMKFGEGFSFFEEGTLNVEAKY